MKSNAQYSHADCEPEILVVYERNAVEVPGASDRVVGITKNNKHPCNLWAKIYDKKLGRAYM